MRSRCRCSVCPAIHINSRSWLRSSSTHEPSDPPHRVVSDLNRCLPPAQHGQKSCALSPESSDTRVLSVQRRRQGFHPPTTAPSAKNDGSVRYAKGRSASREREIERGADLTHNWEDRLAARDVPGHPIPMFIRHTSPCALACKVRQARASPGSGRPRAGVSVQSRMFISHTSPCALACKTSLVRGV